jgi:hypothetical protein
MAICVAQVTSVLIAQPFPPCIFFPCVCPGCSEPMPVFYYNDMTGIFSIDTRGPNGQVDTPQTSGSIQGDDFGLTGMIIASLDGSGAFMEPFNGIDFGQGIFWSTSYASGHYLLSGTFTLRPFLSPAPYDVIQLPTGLGLHNFGSISVSLRAGFGEPTVYKFCSANCVQIVPEPSLRLVLVMSLAFCSRIRRGVVSRWPG